MENTQIKTSEKTGFSLETFTYMNREFFVDQYDSVFEIGETEHTFFCKLNGRLLSDAVTDAVNVELYADDNDEY